VIAQAGTIDIAQTAETLFSTRLGYDVPPELIDDAIPLSPEIALGLEYMRINGEGGWLSNLSWELPKLHTISPELYQIARLNIGQRGLRGPGIDDLFLDRSLSFAAYQMAAIDPGLAITYWDMMQDGKDRASALDLITEGMPAEILPEEAGAKVEAGMKEAITLWQLDERESPVPLLYRLARFYARRGRHNEAVETIKEAVQKIGKEPDARFRDVWLIALISREMKLEEAPAWFDAAIKLAAAGEGGFYGRYSTLNRTDILYPATSAEVLTELAKEDKGDQVLTLARALGNDGLGRNAVAKLASIIDVLSETDLRYAVEVWKLMPDDDRNPIKYDTMTVLGKKLLERDRELAAELLRTLPPGPQQTAMLKAAAPELARTDLHGLIKIVQSVPDARRADAVREIAEAIPIEDIPEFMKILSDWVATRLASYANQSLSEKYYLVTQLSGLSSSTVLALQPVCAKDPDFFASLLLAGVMKDAGLQDDPLWQRLAKAERSYGNLINAGASRLKDNVRDLDPAERFKEQ